MLVTFKTWQNDFGNGESKSVSINPHEVTSVEDYCGTIKPGSVITLKSKKTYLVAGDHDEIVKAIEAGKTTK